MKKKFLPWTLKMFTPSADLPHGSLSFYLMIILLMCGTNLFATTRTATTGNWNTAGTWSPNGIPSAGDNVIIPSGKTVTIDVTTSSISSITISGTLTIGNNNTNRTVTITGNITINTGGKLSTAGDGGNSLLIGGNLINNGTFDMNISSATADVTFNGSGNQTVSGTCTTTDFYTIEVNNTGSINNNIVEINSSDFTATAGFLKLTDGIFKLSGSFTFSNILFATASPTINSDEGIWLNNAYTTITAQNGSFTVSGLLQISAGELNIGNAADNALIYKNGANVVIDGGALNIAGQFRCSNTSDIVNYSQSGGSVTINTVNSIASIYASFDIHSASSSFTMSGGTITLLQPLSVLSEDYINNATTCSVTGGTIQIGNVSSSTLFPFLITSVAPFYNLTIGVANSTSVLLRSDITIAGNLTIGSTLDASTYSHDINVGGDWNNNGSFVQGSRTVTFNGNANQNISGRTSTIFYNFTVNKPAGGVTLNKSTTIQNAGTFTAGIVTSSSSNLLIFNSGASAAGANNGTIPSYVSGPVKKIGKDAFTFPVGATTVGYMPCSISAPSNATDAFTAEYKRSSATALGGITASGLYRVSACEYWQLDRTTGSSAVNVTLSWSGLSPCNAAAYVNDLSSLVIAHFNTTSNKWDAKGANSVSGNGNAGSVTWNNVSSFSPFTLGSTSAIANPLPVKFTMTKAFSVSGGNQIEWTNATEESVQEYQVERSADGITFITIIDVSPKLNNGSQNSYREIDEHVLADVNYYRIKAVSLDGTSEYSVILKVNSPIENKRYIKVYPNPVTTNYFTIQMNNHKPGTYSVRLFNGTGQQILFKTIRYAGGMALLQIKKPASVKPGIYLLQVGGESRLENRKLIIH
ncbi:MAG: G8 domain-containing protein [Chitinophagaceae bacterium]